MTHNKPINIKEIMNLIPHRYPMLLIDRIIEIEEGKRITAQKNVSINEPFFCGHFPGEPIMPGVLIVEAMAQAAAVLVAMTLKPEDLPRKLVYFMSIQEATFRKPVIPGDQMLIYAEVLRYRLNAWRMKGYVTVEGEHVSGATYTAMLINKEEHIKHD